MEIAARRSTPAPARLAVLLVALAAALTGCAEASRVTALEQADRTREERVRALEEQRTALQEQAEQLLRVREEHGRLTAALERVVTRLDALAKERSELGRQLDALQGDAKSARGLQASPRAAEATECRWMGRRAIVLLLRDDTIAAQGFLRLYGDLACPVEHFAAAFACSIPAAAVEEKQEARIDQCWMNPRGNRR